MRYLSIIDETSRTIGEIVELAYPDCMESDRTAKKRDAHKVMYKLVRDGMIKKSVVPNESNVKVAVYYIGDNPVFEARISEKDRRIMAKIDRTVFVRTNVLDQAVYGVRKGSNSRNTLKHLKKLERMGLVEHRMDGLNYEWRLAP